MTKKPENPLQPGVTGSGVPFSQLDTTGYDGSSQSAEEIAASLARIDAMPLTPEMLAGDDEEGEDCEEV